MAPEDPIARLEGVSKVHRRGRAEVRALPFVGGQPGRCSINDDADVVAACCVDLIRSGQPLGESIRPALAKTILTGRN